MNGRFRVLRSPDCATDSGSQAVGDISLSLMAAIRPTTPGSGPAGTGPLRDLHHNCSKAGYLRTAAVHGPKAVTCISLSLSPFLIGPLSLDPVPLAYSFQAISALALFCRLRAGSSNRKALMLHQTQI